MHAAIRRANPSEREKTGLPVCRNKYEKTQALGVILLMVTAVGCGLPGIITIPLMIYCVITGAIPCGHCRKAKWIGKTEN